MAEQKDKCPEPRCEGKGGWTAHSHSKWVTCPTCNGTGEKKLDSPCPRCKGSGLIEVGILRDGVFRGNNIECPDCKGTGRLDRPFNQAQGQPDREGDNGSDN